MLQIEKSILKCETPIRVRFCEVDSMGITWHGSYVKYLEDAREEFGRKYGLGYLDIYGNGFYAPLVKLDINYKTPLKYGDTATVHIGFKNTPSAKIIFQYKIINDITKQPVITAETIQVFLNKNYELVLYNPPFFEKWKTNFELC